MTDNRKESVSVDAAFKKAKTSSLDCAISWTTGWAFSWTIRWALDLAGCIVCRWGCTGYITSCVGKLG